MSTFALSVSDTPEDVIGALNYALSNLGSTVSGNITYSGNILVANTTTGVISSVTSTGTTQVPVISYLYGYVNVKYANSASGASGFTSNSAYANYYGVHNTTDGSISNNPTDYNWTQVSGGFGATKQLYYSTGGGNTVNFNVSVGVPSIYYTPVLDNTPIQLAIIGNSAVVANSIQPRVITNVQIASNTIQGQNIQLNTITANLLAANTIFVSQSLQSTNATFNDPASAGFWLNATNGSARFGSNISVGDNLTVGNNAVIGGNLTVSGLISAGSLSNNTVVTATIANNSVSFGNAVSSVSTQTYVTWSPSDALIYTYVQPQITPTTISTLYINGTVFILISWSGTGQFQWYTNFVRKNITTNTETNLFSTAHQVTLTGVNSYTYSFPVAYLDTPSVGNTYSYYVSITPGAKPSFINGVYFGPGTIVIQQLKR